MVFARRNRRSLLARMTVWLWPPGGFRRGIAYVGYRLLRLPGTPYAIAGGFAWGAAVSFTPFIGLHIVLAAVASWAMRCSLIAATIGTAIGNPWTFPLIWTWIYTCGAWMLGAEAGRAPPLKGLELLFSGLWARTGEAVGAIFGLQTTVGVARDADLAQLAGEVLWPMALGAIPNMIAVWLLFYFPLRRLVAAYQHRRRGGRHWRQRDGRAD